MAEKSNKAESFVDAKVNAQYTKTCIKTYKHIQIQMSGENCEEIIVKVKENLAKQQKPPKK